MRRLKMLLAASAMLGRAADAGFDGNMTRSQTEPPAAHHFVSAFGRLHPTGCRQLLPVVAARAAVGDGRA